jgi:DNA replication protein DnaC
MRRAACLMSRDSLKDATKVNLVDQNGTGKTMLVQNIARQALIAGQAALSTTAGQLLDDLRQAISTCYGSQLQPLVPEFQIPAAGHDDDGSGDAPSF